MARGIIYIILFLLYLNNIDLLYSQSEILFEELGREQGVSQATINCIFKDSRGFMWFGTCAGLNRYDGYNLKVYLNDPFDSTSLSNPYINCIYEDPADSGKFLWIGNWSGGLEKFDQDLETFKHYRFQDNNPNSLTGNNIMDIIKARDGYLWITTLSGGISRFDPKTEAFKNYSHDPANPNSLSHHSTHPIIEDRCGLLWIGTEGGGLNCFDPEKEIYIHFLHDPKDNNSLSNNDVWSLFQDSEGYLWVGTYHGLNRLDLRGFQSKDDISKIASLKFRRYLNDPKFPASISGNWAQKMTEYPSGDLWIATYDGGLNKYDRKNDCFIRYEKNPKNPFALKHNELKSCYKDSENEILWVGSEGGGVYKYARYQNKFPLLQNIPDDPNSLFFNIIYHIYQDREGMIWLALFPNGMDRFDPKTRKFTHFQYPPTAPSEISHKEVHCFFEDQDNNLWLGTIAGLARFDRHSHQFINYLPLSPDSTSLWTYGLYRDTHNNDPIIWVGSLKSGLIKFNFQTCTYEKYLPEDYQPDSTGNNVILCLYPDPDPSKNLLWLGTNLGLSRFDLNSEKFTLYQHRAIDSLSLSYDQIFTIHRDRKGRLWVGTAGGGLNYFNEQEEKFYVYHQPFGSTINYILGILEDDRGNLWLSTFKGLVNFDPETGKFTNYDSRDGLQSDEFMWYSYLKTADGWMYFGGINGLNIFHPDSIQENPHIPPVVLIDFQLFHQSVKPGPNSPLKKSITRSKEIILRYDQDVFAFEFAALDYTIPQKNQYAYQLQGVDREWVYTDASLRRATYTNLDPGDYLFRVKGSNNDGVWNETGASIKVTILPPWWRTSWAYAAYILLIGLAIAGSWYMQVRRLRIKHQLEIEHLQATKLQEIDRVKSRFFTNISHEFRTPITLILGPLERMLSRTADEESRENLGIMQRSAQRLHQLIDQLLDLSKLEAGKMKLQAREVNLTEFLKPVILAFASWAETKKITLTFIPPESPIFLYLDPEMMEKVMNNLLSNALKFTPEGGRISLAVKTTESVVSAPLHHVSITITDTGRGIPPDKLPRIFDRFFQLDDPSTRHPEGTGIGLALTKELVELHHGQITVQSKLGKGSTFAIQLPLGKDHLEVDEIVEVPEKTEKQTELSQELEITNRQLSARQSFSDGQTACLAQGSDRPTIEDKRKKTKDKKLFTLLIVEDNDDMRKYMAGYLEDEYRIITAVNGRDGFDKCAKAQPEAVISDVMMPEMDGFELCKKLKTDERTSHIPVILLTAKADAGSKLEGLETGANDYLTKPFDVKELRLRVHNLIQQRQKLHEHFLRETVVEPSAITSTSLDARFLQKAMQIVETHLNDPDFTVKNLVTEMGMSYSTFFRKLHALTGQSVRSFIRLLRLKKAIILLQERVDNISQVAYEVGFNSPSYFANCFRKQYGHSPSQFLAPEAKK